MIGRQKPTRGLVVDPITVMAALMFGMNTAAKKQIVTRENEHRKFCIVFIVLSCPRQSSSTVSLLGSTHRGEAKITPARRNS